MTFIKVSTPSISNVSNNDFVIRVGFGSGFFSWDRDFKVCARSKNPENPEIPGDRDRYLKIPNLDGKIPKYQGLGYQTPEKSQKIPKILGIRIGIENQKKSRWQNPKIPGIGIRNPGKNRYKIPSA